MNQAIYDEKVKCAYCRAIIKPGELCYILDKEGEIIVCSKTCGRHFEASMWEDYDF